MCIRDRGYTASEHLEVLADHAPGLRIDAFIVDPTFLRGDQHFATFAASLGARVVAADVRSSDGSARHDPNRLASVYADVMGLVAVSYTHLDVYKRQTLMCSSIQRSSQRPVPWRNRRNTRMGNRPP